MAGQEPLHTRPRVAGRNRDGYWELRWSERIGGGWRSRSVSTRTKDRQEADAFLTGFLVDFDQDTTARGSGDGADLGALVASYLEAAEGRDVKPTQAQSLVPIRALLGALCPRDLTPAVVASYVAKRAAGQGTTQGRRAGSSTCRRELGALAAVLSWAEKKMLIPRGSSPHLDLPPPGAPRDFWLTEPQEQRLWDFALAQAPAVGQGRLPRATRFLCIALETAARKASIEGLTWDRVDLTAGLIDFRDPGLRVTKKRRVPVPISDRLLPVLKRAKREATGPYVCDQGAIRASFETLMGKAGKDLGAPFGDVTPHVLRHTWATLAARRGVPIWQIAGVLGDTLATVEAHYAHHSPDYLRSAMVRPVLPVVPPAPNPLADALVAALARDDDDEAA